VGGVFDFPLVRKKKIVFPRVKGVIHFCFGLALDTKRGPNEEAGILQGGKNDPKPR